MLRRSDFRIVQRLSYVNSLPHINLNVLLTNFFLMKYFFLINIIKHVSFFHPRYVRSTNRCF